MSSTDVSESLEGAPPSSGSASHEPPPEKSGSAWTRWLILSAFWVVAVIFGLPHWISTTSIHRSNLPLESMNSWADGKACQLHYPIQVRLRYPEVDQARINNLAAQVEGLLNAENSLPLYHFHVAADLSNGTAGHDSHIVAQHEDLLTAAFKESALIVNVQTDKKAKSTEATLKSLVPVLEVRHNPGHTVDPATLSPFIANEVRKIFDNEKDFVSHLLKGSAYADQAPTSDLSPEVRAQLDAKTTRAFKYASTYHLTFSLFTSSASPSSWDIERALAENIEPLLSRLSSISQFTVDTQVQLYASFSPSIAGPQYDPSTRQYQLQRTDLSGFINAAEWPLSPGIGSGPTINFVLYVPSKDQTPLVLAETGGTSWVVPQWGGVQILNPTGKQFQHLTSEDLRPVMLTFADHLTTLVGLPPSPPSLSLRISSLTRSRATSLILSASSTLGALSRLTLKLTSIAIPDAVAKSVAETIHRLDMSCQHLQDGRYQSAIENARVAEREAEKAFFEPSMVGQVYFPDEHKVAVYVPLLGPMAVPLVISALKEVRGWRGRKAKVA